MKLIHLSDLHLGKRVNEFPMLDDQIYILTEILGIIDDEQPDGVLIAGDVYDKSVPSVDAVNLFDDFLVRLAERKLPVFIISGNHDSSDRLAFANRLIESSGIHIAPAYSGHVEPLVLEDEYGPVNLYLLPFVKPVHVRKCFPEDNITTYDDAVRRAVREMRVDRSERNVLMTHQFVTGAARSDSEELSVGGTDNVDASAFDDFDYVALGHIHGPQNIGSERIRYCGTPMKYSFSELNHQKSVTVAELGEKGTLTVRTVPLIPRRDMGEIRGTYEELTRLSFYEGTDYPDNYMHIILTDEEDVPDAVGRLRVVYKNLMKLDYDNARTRHTNQIEGDGRADQKPPFEVFSEFYQLQNNAPMSDQQAEYIRRLIEEIWEDEA